MIHSVQQFYDEDIDLRVKISEHMIPILEDQTNDGNLMNQLFTFRESKTNIITELGQQLTNPFAIIEVAVNCPKVNVWCAVSNKQIISPQNSGTFQ